MHTSLFEMRLECSNNKWTELICQFTLSFKMLLCDHLGPKLTYVSKKVKSPGHQSCF